MYIAVAMVPANQKEAHSVVYYDKLQNHEGKVLMKPSKSCQVVALQQEATTVDCKRA